MADEVVSTIQPVGRVRRARNKPPDPYADKETPRRVVMYVRVSREEEAQGHSLGAQERECREYLAQAKPHWTLVKVFRETHSGKDDSRPEFRRMLELVYAGQADAILTHHLDRFSRSLHDILNYFRELESRNVVLTFAKDQFDFSTEEGRLQFHILAVFADWYLRNLSRETKKGKQERVKVKHKHNNQLPFGYRVGADGVGEIVPEEAEALQQAYELYAAGNTTDAEIAAYFNSLGLRTRRGRAFSKDSIREIMQNETYLGLVKYHNDLYPGKHPAIIPQELFDRVQAVRKEHAHRPRVYSTNKQVYLLGGIIYCATCGRTLRGQGGKTKKYNYYRDMSKQRGFTCPHASAAIRQEEAEGQLEQLITALQLPADWQMEIQAVLEAEDVQTARQAERQKLEQKLRRLAELYADGLYDRATYQQERDKVQQALDVLEPPTSESALEAGYQLETLADIWPYALGEERRELVQLIFERVYVDLETKRLVRVVVDADFHLLFRHHPYLTPDEAGGYRISPALFASL